MPVRNVAHPLILLAGVSERRYDIKVGQLLGAQELGDVLLQTMLSFMHFHILHEAVELQFGSGQLFVDLVAVGVGELGRLATHLSVKQFQLVTHLCLFYYLHYSFGHQYKY